MGERKRKFRKGQHVSVPVHGRIVRAMRRYPKKGWMYWVGCTTLN